MSWKLTVTQGNTVWIVELPPGTSTIGRPGVGMRHAVELDPTDASSAEHHADIYSGETSCSLARRGSAPVFVNGRPVDRADLKSGDVVRIGSAELRVEASVGGSAAASRVRLGPLPSQGARPTAEQQGATPTAPPAPASAQTGQDQRARPQQPAPDARQGGLARASAGADLGFRIGTEDKNPLLDADGAAKEGSSAPRPGILIAGAVAVVLLLIMMSVDTRSGSHGVSQNDIARVASRYKNYLEKRKLADPSLDVEARHRVATRLLETSAYHSAVGSTAQAQSELRALMALDADSESPLYGFAVEHLEE